MIRSWATLVRHYCDLLRFWRDCPDKKCRRARRCRDHSGDCWNRRYPRTGEARERLRARVKAARVHLPAAARELPQRCDPSDALL
jgi:hypothetical protein